MNAPLNIPEPPPHAPVYVTGVNTAACDTAKIEWMAWCTKNENIKNINTALTSMLPAVIELEYKDDIEIDMTGMKNCTFVQIFEMLIECYG